MPAPRMAPYLILCCRNARRHVDAERLFNSPIRKTSPMKTPMTPLSEVMNELRKRGYTEDFNLRTDCLDCQQGQFLLYPEDFQIDKYYRFEGESDPADQAILYAISSEKFGLKG